MQKLRLRNEISDRMEKTFSLSLMWREREELHSQTKVIFNKIRVKRIHRLYHYSRALPMQPMKGEYLQKRTFLFGTKTAKID